MRKKPRFMPRARVPKRKRDMRKTNLPKSFPK
jgi:hypothetical protein